MTDPVRNLRTKVKDRPSFYWTIIFFTITVVGGLLLFVKVSHESSARTHQLQDVICGVYVPIAQAPLSTRSTPLGKTIVLATRHGALELHCPGLRR